MGDVLHSILANGSYEISVLFGDFVCSGASPDPGCNLWLDTTCLGLERFGCCLPNFWSETCMLSKSLCIPPMESGSMMLLCYV